MLDLDDADIYDEPPDGEAAAAAAEAPLLTVTLVYKGRSEAASVRGREPLSALFAAAAAAFALPPERHSLKLILKGKALQPDAVAADVLGASAATATATATPPKIMVMASAREAVAAAQGAAAAAVADKSVASFAAEHGGKKGRVPTAKGARQASVGKKG